MGSTTTTLQNNWLLTALEIMSVFFIFIVGLIVLVMIAVFIYDVSQRKQAVLRNFPVVGHFRYLFEHLGEFFRQYFFAMDREELPFNRAQRTWAYRAAKDLNNTVAFGSTRNLMEPGAVTFVSDPFPTLTEDSVAVQPMVIGAECKQPYEAKCFLNISGMSYGAISRPAVIALSAGAHRVSCWMNTGEGGLSPYHLQGGADLVYQIGTAKYGVRDSKGQLSDAHLQSIAKHEQVKMFELKLSQGAKPGKGGILPAVKVTEEVASIRGIPVNQASISPNRHPDISNVEELLDVLVRVREVTGKPVGFKTVLSGTLWLEKLFEAILSRGIESAPDFITVDGADGGTGAAPMPLMDDVGLPLTESLPMLVDKLIEYGLRDRIRVIASGKLMMPSSVAWALCIGADFIVSARGFMFSLGCIQAMQCNKNTCPTGITTHSSRLQKGLDPGVKEVRVENYHKNLVKEVSVIAHSCGAKKPRDLKRDCARMVVETGRSVPLDQLYPLPQPRFHPDSN